LGIIRSLGAALSNVEADSVRPGTVLVLSQPAGLYNSTLGGIMATRTQRLGVAGVVVDGQIRDINHIRGIELPVFARGHSIVSAGAECRPRFSPLV